MREFVRSIDRSKAVMILVYVATTAVLFMNITRFESSIVGFVSSIIYLYISSVLSGNIFWREEFSWRKMLFGFSVVIVLLSLGGASALMLRGLSSNMVGVVLVCVASILILLNLLRRGPSDVSNSPKIEDNKKRRHIYSGFNKLRILQVLYIGLAVLSFFILFISRSEEVFSILGVVNPAFFPALFASTAVLLILLFSKTSNSAKISLIVVHSILIHGILAIVLNPGWQGDVWRELGRIREIVNFGKYIPNIFVLLEQQWSPYRIVYYSVRKKTFQVLVRVFASMFGTDIYWIQILLMPLLWSILTPFFMYEIVRILGGKGNSRILAAFLPLSATMLTWIGAVGLPDALSPVFFCLTVYLMLRYLHSSKQDFLLFALCLMSIAVSLMVHFKTGIIGMSIFLLALALKVYRANGRSVTRKIMLALSICVSVSLLPASLFALYGVYPEAGYMHTQFNLDKLLSTGPWELVFGGYVNFSTQEVLLFGLIPFLGIAGLLYVLVYRPKKSYNYFLCLLVFLTELVLILDYRILKYAMDNIPFTAERIWVLRDLLFIPFGAIVIASLIRKIHAWTPRGLSQLRLMFRRFPSGFSVIILILSISLSSFVVEATTNAYTKKNILNPTSYEVDAIRHIVQTTPERYIVIGDSIFSYLAYGILGVRYDAVFLRKLFFLMYPNPSVEAMDSTLETYDASVGYFVISVRYQKFNEVVAKAQEIFDIYAILGDGNLYIFRYPRVERDYVIPIKVVAGNYSRVDYVIEYELNWTQVLFGTASMHLDQNSISVVDENNKEAPSQHENFQALFENCSLLENWSAGSSDGDLLTYSIYFTNKTGEAGVLAYAKFEAGGGDLRIESQKYKYIEIKWKVNYEAVANIRLTFMYKVRNITELKTAWAHPTANWNVFRLDYPKAGQELCGLTIVIFEAKPGDWTGDYELSIDWMRFVSDTGVMRWLYNGTADTESEYRIVYDFLENTGVGDRDHLPAKSHFDEKSSGNDDFPPPDVSTWIPIKLSVATVDLLDQPLEDVAVEFPELGIDARTDEDGWADAVVPQGEWAVVVSKNGLVYERNIEIFANSIIRQRLDFVQIDDLVMNTLQFTVFTVSIVIVCLFVLLFLHRKCSAYSTRTAEREVHERQFR